MHADFVEVATSPEVYSSGAFAGEFLEENTVLFDPVEPLATEYEASETLSVGTYYVHVGGYLPEWCDYDPWTQLPCLNEFSPAQTLTIPPPSSPTPQVSQAPSGQSGSGDAATAFASLRIRRKQSIRSLRVTTTVAEAASVTAGGIVHINRGRSYKLRETSVNVRPGKRRTLRLRLGREGLDAARRALRRRLLVRATIKVRLRDLSGNTAASKRTVTLGP